MLPSHRSLPLPYHLFDLAGRQAEQLGLRLGDLRPETLMQDAHRLTGLDDFGNPYFQAGLEKLLESLEKDAHLRFYGRLVMRFMIANSLSQRLLFVHVDKENPGLFQSLTQPPIVVTGLHRSGTTFLHRLLALDPAHASLPFWWLYRPFQVHGLMNLRKIKAWAELAILKPIFPAIQCKHRIRPSDPEESTWMLGQTFHSMVFWILAPVTSYLGWLWEQDFRPVYQDYARLLAACQSAAPGKRLVLKAPDHMPHLDLLLDALPGAHIVQLHRDPATCVLSLSSLFYSTHIALSENVQPRVMAETNQAMTANFIRANRRIRQDPAVDSLVLDLDFKELVADPLGTVRRIYTRFGLDFSKHFADKLAQFIGKQKNHTLHSHRYTGDQFGLSEPAMRAFFQDL